MIRVFWIALIVVLAALTWGCRGQNELFVRVERVVIDDKDDSGRLQEDSRYGRAVLATIGALNEMTENYHVIRAAVSAGGKDPEAGAFREFVEPYIVHLASAENEFQGVIAGLLDLFEVKDATGLAPTILVRLVRAQMLFQAERHWIESTLDDLAANIDDPSEKAVFASLVDKQQQRVLDRLKEVELRLRQSGGFALGALSDIQNVGFGGFSTVGIFEINAADPVYRKILGEECVTLSCDSFTRAWARIDGDSSIMFVMESPGQIRIYQIQNDPTQLIRNIAILIQKATSAATRILSTMLLP